MIPGYIYIYIIKCSAVKKKHLKFFFRVAFVFMLFLTHVSHHFCSVVTLGLFLTNINSLYVCCVCIEMWFKVHLKKQIDKRNTGLMKLAICGLSYLY